MLFIELNNGSTINVFHISEIKLDKTNIIYAPAKGSLNNYIESFKTENEAIQRYTELQDKLLVK